MIAAERLAFVNDYLFGVMTEMLRTRGVEDSGFYNFYRARIEDERTALSGYDRILLSYITSNFNPAHRPVVHAGIGLGTLASALAIGGFTVGGVEEDGRRFQAATQLRMAVTEMWPEVDERYELIQGSFPRVALDTKWLGASTILIFTNCGSGWSEELTEEVISVFPRFGDVILDARLFGTIRDLPEEHAALLARIEKHGMAARPIPETNPLGAYYHHIRPHLDGPWPSTTLRIS